MLRICHWLLISRRYADQTRDTTPVTFCIEKSSSVARFRSDEDQLSPVCKVLLVQEIRCVSSGSFRDLGNTSLVSVIGSLVVFGPSIVWSYWPSVWCSYEPNVWCLVSLIMCKMVLWPVCMMSDLMTHVCEGLIDCVYDGFIDRVYNVWSYRPCAWCLVLSTVCVMVFMTRVYDGLIDRLYDGLIDPCVQCLIDYVDNGLTDPYSWAGTFDVADKV